MENIQQAETAVARVTGGGSAREVAPGVACLALSIVNVYLIGEPGARDRSWILVDAGLAFSTAAILRAAAERFGPASRPAAIVLTHGHFDHVGTLPELAERWDAPVYAHPLEMPFLTGRSGYPPPDPAVGGGAMAFLSRFYPRGPINLGGRSRPLPAGEPPAMPGWRWIHTPGHTAGHISLFRDADRTLIAGDAFVTTAQESALAVLTRRQQVSRPPAYYTSDWHAARESVETLARLRPEVAAAGHGRPMRGEPLRAGLDALLQAWEQAAIPRQGRYVGEPAITNEQGVVRLPPAVADPSLPVVAGVGLLAVLGVLLMRGGGEPRRMRGGRRRR
jgi:glyoxylase-like metal-dependent hydrolase (beta-lactamase superfamily II)